MIDCSCIVFDGHEQKLFMSYIAYQVFAITQDFNMIRQEEQLASAVIHRRSTKFFLRYPHADPHDQHFTSDEAQTPTELDLLCSGHGVFAEHHLLLSLSFIDYLGKCQTAFPGLVSLRVTFNAVNLGEGIFQRLITTFLSFSHLHKVHLHTSHLTNATADDFKRMLDVMGIYGADVNCEDFSLQIAAWSFEQTFDFDIMYEVFIDFAAQTLSGLYFKTFRLQISSLCMGQRQTQLFLRRVTTSQELMEGLMLKKGYDSQNRPVEKLLQRFKDNQKNQIRLRLKEFLRVGMQMNYSQIAAMPINEEFRQLVGRGLLEMLIDARLELFYRGMIKLVEMLLEKMPEVTEFFLDLRNWNEKFHLDELVTKLKSKFGMAKNEYSIINSRKLTRQESRINMPEGRENYVKKVYLI